MLISIKTSLQSVLNQFISKKWTVPLVLIIVLSSCSSSRFGSVKKDIITHLGTRDYQNQFTGFLVVDLETKDTLFNINSEKYFIPASTVKLFSFYTALKTLGKHSPLLKYKKQQDSLYIMGTGNPTPFHPFFKDSTLVAFLNQYDTIVLTSRHYVGEKYGPGWAWEDYPSYFSPEVSALPIYGNVLSVTPGSPPMISPQYFKNAIDVKNGTVARAWESNRFYLPDRLQDTLEIPFITSDSLTVQLLREKISAQIVLSGVNPKPGADMVYGIATDSILKRMLSKSDNFLAEQTMLMASATLSDTLSFALARDHVLKHQLQDLDQPPRWVDGSGLSRYNLFSPQSMIAVLTQLYYEIDTARLFSLMPRWNEEGTMDPDTVGYSTHFLVAKSGSMGNIYNLCGYLKTTSGKLLAFSFMNNHFRKPSKEIRAQMFLLLKSIHNTY